MQTELDEKKTQTQLNKQKFINQRVFRNGLSELNETVVVVSTFSIAWLNFDVCFVSGFIFMSSI